ncbi:hypothetical protein APR12_002223 [Nocardia amikacinitolerans]|uniref:hypothetical protein n=1 Tax=Nocardia amikacinitolerans TaxID=756689 RepID=UPI000AB9ACBD|nr:hypothetical protein [Nocardia amikacinitolerans]MCP2316883.1 hypothetical protein [Nocardia amikacinitolerans]
MRNVRRTAAFTVAGLVFAGMANHSAAVADTGCVLVGTVGTPEVTVDETTAGMEALASADVELPERIHFRTTTESFNRRWTFATRDGGVYVKETATQGGWRTLVLPGCLEGRVVGVSADDDEVMMIDRDGRFFTMDHALSAPRDWNWSSRYGTPLWTGPGNSLPPGTSTWSWSVLSPNEDHVWRDTAGNDHPVGGAKVSHVFALTNGGQRIRYIDPWLPVDHSYEMATPHGGRFQAVALSTSASTSLIVNRFGDFYTRLYDFDISGADKVFFRYSYDDQSGLPEAPDMLAERVDSRYAAIQLPAPDWVRQPKVPGDITDRISIHRTGPGSAARELRVEGRDSGRNGYWAKQLTADSWTFVPTDQPLVGTVLENSPTDRSLDTLVAPSPFDYEGVATQGWSARVRTFDVAVTPTPLRIDFGDGKQLNLVLHTVDGLRQTPQLSGISSQPRHLDGTIESPPELLAGLDAQPAEVRDFVRNVLRGSRFTETSVVVTDTRFHIDRLDLTLNRS